MQDFKIGDFVGFVFAQPGNDTTQLVVIGVDGDKIKCWDVWFDFEISIAPDRLWILTEREMEGLVLHHKHGRITIKQRLEQVRNQKCA